MKFLTLLGLFISMQWSWAESVFLEWSPVDGVQDFEFVIKGKTIKGKELTQNLKATKIELDVQPGFYEWRVRGKTPGGKVGEWTTWNELFVMPEATPRLSPLVHEEDVELETPSESLLFHFEVMDQGWGPEFEFDFDVFDENKQKIFSKAAVKEGQRFMLELPVGFYAWRLQSRLIANQKKITAPRAWGGIHIKKDAASQLQSFRSQNGIFHLKAFGGVSSFESTSPITYRDLHLQGTQFGVYAEYDRSFRRLWHWTVSAEIVQNRYAIQRWFSGALEASFGRKWSLSWVEFSKPLWGYVGLQSGFRDHAELQLGENVERGEFEYKLRRLPVWDAGMKVGVGVGISKTMQAQSMWQGSFALRESVWRWSWQPEVLFRAERARVGWSAFARWQDLQMRRKSYGESLKLRQSHWAFGVGAFW